jgi:Dockerin type I domain
MQRNPPSESGAFNPRILVAVGLCSAGVLLAMVSFAAMPSSGMTDSSLGSQGDSSLVDAQADANAIEKMAPHSNAPGRPGWSIIVSPKISSSQTLLGVTCVSESDCWAVGSYWPDLKGLTLIEHWDGTSWAIVPSPNIGVLANVLNTVACASASECWAIGSYADNYSHPFPILMEHWDGFSWSIVSSPTSPGELHGIACASPSECWAVGVQVRYPAGQGLIERWDGTAWAIVTSPETAPGQLDAVTCASESECWAVGHYYPTSGLPGPQPLTFAQTLIEHWDGTSWSIVSSPNTDSRQSNALVSVTCASGSDCWAVGTAAHMLTEHWNGNSWSIVASPIVTETGVDFAYGVTCASASDCWMVGYTYTFPMSQTVIEHWDGRSWSIVPSPNPSATLNLPFGVTCASASECWTVGVYDDNALNGGALIELYSLTIPPLTSVVSSKIHGSAGTFDTDLPLIGDPGIECRIPGATGTRGIDYKVVFSFVNPVTNCGVAGIGSASFGPNLNQCTVNLSNVPNAHYTTVSLNNVLDSQNNSGNVSVQMGLLVGDVSGDGKVTASDVSLVKAQVGTPVTESNFRSDVSADGSINTRDVRITKTQIGNKLRP